MIVIQRKVRSVDALLDEDGSPLVEPRIHPEVAESIWKEALLQRRRPHFAIELTVPNGEPNPQSAVTDAVHFHFAQRAAESAEELRDVYREGWRCLGIGLIVAVLLLLASEGLVYIDSTRISQLLSESMIILAWVALWHPAELLLYAHFPVRHQLRTAQALARADVRLKAD